MILKEGEKLPEGWGGSNGTAAEPAPKPEKKEEKPNKEAEAAEDEKPEPEEGKQDKPAKQGRVVASPLAKRLAKRKRRADRKHRGHRAERPHRGARRESRPRNPQACGNGGERRRQAGPAHYLAAHHRRAHRAQQANRAALPGHRRSRHGRLEDLREKLNTDNPDKKIGVNDFIVRACAMTLADQPHVNASFDASGKRREFGAINIGLAIAVPDGLTVGVLHDCKNKTLRQIAEQAKDLVKRARDNKMSPEEISGSTFTISNMGMFDIHDFNAIINEPNGAIIAVGSARPIPVAIETDEGYELEVRRRMLVTGSFDHRIIDGAVGAAFLGALKAYLEKPTLLLS